MPELPEVETVRQTLKKNILNKAIKDIDVYYDRIIRNVSVDEFKSKLINQKFVDILRRGKYLIFVLEDYLLISHLRMEGKYNLMADEDISKHEHIVFKLDQGISLRYDDVRKFGTMDLFPLMDLRDLYNIAPLNRIANDPFEDDFSNDEVYLKLSKSKKPIKSALLDQSIISGIGNIYADEILFRSNLHPLVISNSLSRAKVDEIIENVKLVLEKAISLGGTTIKSFTSSHSISGRFQNELKVHTMKTCPNCSLDINKIKVGGRTSYYCRECQKLN